MHIMFIDITIHWLIFTTRYFEFETMIISLWLPKYVYEYKETQWNRNIFLSSLHLGGHFGRLSMTRISWVELGERSGRDTLQHFFGEDTEELPANIQRFKHGTVFIVT